MMSCGSTTFKKGADSVFQVRPIPDLKIGKHGQLQEWSEDYDEPSPGMSHVSHLFALFPADEITLRGTPAMAAAAYPDDPFRIWHGGRCSTSPKPYLSLAPTDLE